MGVRIEGFDGMMRHLKNGARKIVDKYLQDLSGLGDRAITFIREKSREEGIEDRSGNYRSSIGYVVVRDGQIAAKGGFDRVDGPERAKSTVDGSQEGEEYAKRLAKNYPKGYALIVVVGVENAAYLQSIENKDVLASGEIFLNKELNGLVAEYKRKYGK